MMKQPLEEHYKVLAEMEFWKKCEAVRDTFIVFTAIRNQTNLDRYRAALDALHEHLEHLRSQVDRVTFSREGDAQHPMVAEERGR
jgi:chromosome condensin MukBEF ATPase and DNA-binding subunit MukB